MSDLINRQAALDIFKPWLEVKGYSEGELNMLRAVIYELESMPGTSAWISVKDKLPKIGESVITCYTSEMMNGEKYRDIDLDFVDNTGRYFYLHSKTTTHWFRIPELPKETDAE